MMPFENTNLLAPNVQRYMDTWGLTRKEFCEKVGITRQWLWELMQPNKRGIHFATLLLLAEKTEWGVEEWIRLAPRDGVDV